jgi:hypothetical protein
MKTNIILLCILIFLILIYINNTNTNTGSREGLTVTNPLAYKLTDENITKIYRSYCDKFPNDNMPFDDWKRQQSVDTLIGDAKSWLFGSSTRANACSTNPPVGRVSGEVLTDDLRAKIYGIFCDKPITLTDARKSMKFDEIWTDATNIAMSNSPDCFSTIINPNGLTDSQITSIYQTYCDKFGLPGGLQINSKMRNQPINEAIDDAKFYAADPLSGDLCYKTPPIITPPIILTDEIKQKIWSGYCQAPLPVKEPISGLSDLFTKAISYSQTNKYCLSPITNTIFNGSEGISTINDINLDKLLKSIFRIQFSDNRIAFSDINGIWGGKSASYQKRDLWMLKKQPTAMGGYRFYNLLSKMSLAVGTDGPYMWIDLPNENNFTFDIKNSPTGIKIINRVSNKMLYSDSPNNVTDGIPLSAVVDNGSTAINVTYDVKFNIVSTSQDLYYLLNYPFKIKHVNSGNYIVHDPLTKIVSSTSTPTDNSYFILQPQNGNFKFVFKSSNMVIYIHPDKMVKSTENGAMTVFEFSISQLGESNRIINVDSSMSLIINTDVDTNVRGDNSFTNDMNFYFEF